MYTSRHINQILDKTLFITTGLGATNFEAAAGRVHKHLAKYVPESNILVVTSSNLDDLCFRTRNLFNSTPRNQTPGFGFWTWKSELVYRALNGELGEFDSVVYLDSGCEVFLNFFSLQRLTRQIEIANETGAFVFDLDTSEDLYSKEILKRKFSYAYIDNDNQIQATWFILSGSIGHSLAKRWLEVTLADLAYSDDTLTKNDYALGVQSRNDQSIFSLTCKELGIQVSDYQPIDGKSVRSKIRGIFHPIWTSRNRSGQTLKFNFKK